MEYISRAEHDEFAKRIHDEDARQNHRIKELEDKVDATNKLLVVIEKLTNNIENMQKEIKRQGERLLVIENRDGENWRKAVWLVVSLVIGGVVGYILKHIGL